jgi:hypothetical protein
LTVLRTLLIASTLALLLAAAPRTDAQDTTGAPAAPLPRITVTAKALERSVGVFVSRVSGAWVTADDRPMARWHSPVCALVAGWPQTEGQAIFDRLSLDVASVGVALDKVGCRPNFYVMGTAQPDALLKDWAHHDVNLFGGGYGSHKFLATQRPIRVWYNVSLTDRDGIPATSFGIGTTAVFAGVPTFLVHGEISPRFAFSVIPGLGSVIAVIDLTRMNGLDVNQVTDYVVMAGLSEVNFDANFGDAPTILRLFSAAADARPAGLSAWDTAYLKALYQTSQSDRHQRVEIAKRMLGEVAP